MKKFILLGCCVALISLSGCTSIKDIYTNIENKLTGTDFEQVLIRSQDYIVEARLLLSEGEIEKAKEYLDKAYLLYPRQASLHKTYETYYMLTGHDGLASLAAERFNAMVFKSEGLNRKGHYAMTKMENLILAEKLFSLSLVYHDENTSTIMNIATLGYSTGDYQLAAKSLRMLERLGHVSPESTLLNYALAKRTNDEKGVEIAKFIMKVSFPNSRQHDFIMNNEHATS